VPSRLLVKVCCIQDEGEMRLAAGAGATHVGLVGAMPSGPGPLPDADIARMAAGAPPGVETVLLTSRTDAGGIVDHVRVAGVRAVQIVRDVPPDVRRAVRRALPAIGILQVVHVQGERSLAMASEAAEGADYLLLDSGRPDAVVAELGGTGRTHDWALSAQIVKGSPVPVLLAGGLDPGNVADAIRRVRPTGVVLCSGVRDGSGRLVADRLRAFMEAVHGAS